MRDYQRFLNETYAKIEDKWEFNFNDYLKNISDFEVRNKNLKKINETVDNHLGIYTSISCKSNCYDVRYNGQSVAKYENGKFSLKKNLEAYFENVPDITNLSEDEVLSVLNDMEIKKKLHSPEHVFESRLLKEMKKGKDKVILRNITPICIKDLFFQMPTFFASSKHEEIAFSVNGGGIDIFARIQIKNEQVSKRNHLCIMELKDEFGRKGETPDIVMEQAISYACCIQKLLRSEKGKDWYNFFRNENGDSKEIPETLILYACVVTPCPQDGNIPDEYKIEDEISFPDSKDKLKLRCIYFNLKENKPKFKNLETIDE